MSTSSDAAVGTTGGSVRGTSTEILLATVFFFFMTVCFVLFLCIYLKWRFGPGAGARAEGANHVDEPGESPETRGLDLGAIKSLPTVVFESKDFRCGMECAVCLSEIRGGEKIRLLPKCGHGFHVDCIDVWLFSQSTCPLCRNSVGPQPDSGLDDAPGVTSTDGSSPGSAALPTNVLFWGTPSGRVREAHASAASPPPASSPSSSSSSQGVLVIDVPSGEMGEFPSEDDQSAKSRASSTTASPTLARLRSLRTLLSRGKRAVAGLGCSNRAEASDLEQGCPATTSVGTSKTTSEDLRRTQRECSIRTSDSELPVPSSGLTGFH